MDYVQLLLAVSTAFVKIFNKAARKKYVVIGDCVLVGCSFSGMIALGLKYGMGVNTTTGERASQILESFAACFLPLFQVILKLFPSKGKQCFCTPQFLPLTTGKVERIAHSSDSFMPTCLTR